MQPEKKPPHRCSGWNDVPFQYLHAPTASALKPIGVIRIFHLGEIVCQQDNLKKKITEILETDHCSRPKETG